MKRKAEEDYLLGGRGQQRGAGRMEESAVEGRNEQESGIRTVMKTTQGNPLLCTLTFEK